MTGSRIWKSAVVAVLVSLPALLILPKPSDAAVASFDSRGPALDLLLRDIRQEHLAGGAVAAPRGAPVRPIILTVSGLALDEIGWYVEFRHLKEAWNWLFPGKSLDEEALRERIEEFNRLNGAGAAGKVKKPQNYLETDIRAAAERVGLDAEVVNFWWSRDPEDSEQATAEFQQKLWALSGTAQAEGRPIYIIAHSWGTVLMHDALNKLDSQGKTVRVRRFVTMGSPIVPTRFFVWLFKEIEDLKERLQKRVRRPAGVEHWVNLWAEYDSFSGMISAADSNERVDLDALPYARRLEALLETDQKKQAKADLKVLGSSPAWHESYRQAFETPLKSLGETPRWDVLDAHLGEVLPARL